MNYFTKEWYELCQKIDSHLLLEKDKQAESFSEEFFHELYNEELTEFLDLWKEVASISDKPFDRKKISEEFHKSFLDNQEHIKKILPEEILKNIADIRVYVLNKASKKVIDSVTQFCKNNEKTMYRTIKEYEKYYEEASKLFDRDMVENINFHDCIIMDIRQTEQFLSIVFDNSGGFTDIDEMQFENYKIIKQDGLLQNSWWLYDEIYKINDKYELHVLLQNKNNDLVEFIVSAENISFKHNQENKSEFC